MEEKIIDINPSKKESVLDLNDEEIMNVFNDLSIVDIHDLTKIFAEGVSKYDN